ncbi:ankyrin repeat and MYND domain-containing protein 1 [Diretmus argenteus]
MLSTFKCVPAAPGHGGRQHTGYREAHIGGEERRGVGVQEWPDGSKYEGEFVNGLKHGRGKYTWENGESYEGSFYKDYRHGEGVHCWPTGHKFIGKFYLNRKEGYGLQRFPDGTTFQGLYHTDQRFGPGVVSYPDGRQDVGLWHSEHLLRLCTSQEGGFSLDNFPGYAAYNTGPTATIDSLTQVETDPLRSPYKDLLSDESFILPPNMESYSTDGDHLPLPPGRRRELDQHFHGELWEPDPHKYLGYDRDPISTLPLQRRMQAHIYRHRLQAVSVGWDVAAVVSLTRDGFGPKGPLEVSSERLIQLASLGERQAVSQILRTGLVHPDVADARGNTALIAATVNCHNDVIHLLLDMGANIDYLNCDGMSALAVCHVLYYPIQSLHTTTAEKIPLKPLAKTQAGMSRSTWGNSPPTSPVDFTTDTTRTNNRLGSNVSDDSDRGFFTDLHNDLLDGAETTAHTEHLKEREEKEKEEGEDGDGGSKETEREDREAEGDEERENEQRDVEKGQEEERDVLEKRTIKKGEKEDIEQERKKENLEEKTELGQEREIEAAEGDGEEGEERDVEMRESDIKDVEEREVGGGQVVPGEDCSIQVLDGHIPVGIVWWKKGQAGAAGTVQATSEECHLTPTLDSACSVESFNILVTEEVMQRSAEALRRTGVPQHADTQQTVRKIAAMKIEHRVRWKTLKLLLDRGADPNASRIPMPVLFLATKAADAEAVKRLLLCGARTDIPLPPEWKGLYPLHIAAALPGPAGPRITELLLHAITNPDNQASDQDDIYELDKVCYLCCDTWAVNLVPLQTSVECKAVLGNKTAGPTAKYSSPPREAPMEGGRTALHVACQRDSDYNHAREVVALLLAHRASTHLLWSGHSPLSLAIASGNEQAVEELLKEGADPNLPLSCRVGSALCAVANINYHSGGHPGFKAKMLDTLVKAGANIMMPVMVGQALGTAVDYAHHSFNQDSHIANTPYNTLKMRDRETLKTRLQLLSIMGDLLRKPFKFCYQCSRSVSVVLTACSRCHQVFYCSKTCKRKAWDERHKDECIRVQVRKPGTQQNAGLKSQRPPRPLSVAQKISENHLDLKENYSSN